MSLRQRGASVIKAVGATATAGLVVYPTYLYQTDEGSRRMIQAYSSFVPVVLHYRWMEFIHKLSPMSDEEWEAMDQKYAVPTVAQLARLQGMYTKYGQTAAGLTNTLGDAWIHELRKLEDKVPPRSTDVVFQTVREETNKQVEETFSYFDPTPLGSASIGQVHKAVLRQDGREVAVKVQYPEAQHLFEDDMKTIRKFFEIFGPEHIVLLDALERQNALELDYQKEADNLTEVRTNMIQDGFQPREAVVPAAMSEYTTRRMLVMELLPGPKLIDGVRAFYAKWAEEHGTTLHELEMEVRARIETEGVPSKYEGPPAWQLDMYRRWLGVQDLVHNWGRRALNVTFYWNDPLPLQQSVLPANTPRIIDTLMRIHGSQLLRDGVFNADPHGGNFLLLPDGRLGLIDYGATNRLTWEERITTCVLYAALHRRDEQMLFELCSVGGYKSRHGRRDVLIQLLQLGFDTYGKDLMGNRNIQQFVDHLKAEDPYEEVPDNYAMAQFMSIRLRSLAMGMNHPIRCSDWWGPIAEEVLREEGHPYESWDRAKMERYKPDLNMQQRVMSNWSLIG
eukprot:Nitzschia sp. Nitz4//scaffold276_size25055//7976//9750//NITZ4_008339-RA/size25055-augustus-gene-0.14-mRNA-1//1//CDS//3329545319//2289//frame0